ncbi:hypothetical protein FOL47_006102 [Perkinsus chesapeaki]|uniref:Alpha-galactosidase n=1 Tax=Perkinsus chesapeaki TaxID=330153 RepID=A0A7J6MYH1_PERCH|nr:hypothetical protein FOL47_006102 [Perkinsus chesapeaki]
MAAVIYLLLFFVSFQLCYALDNGLALTPPMGWLSWERFGCETDCKTHPDTCISEKLYTDMADILIEEGYKDLGYEYVNIDDCWSTMERDPQTGEMVPDPERFPHGIKWLADYMHERGLKLGLYADIGSCTCAGYPGLEGFFEQDVKTFAEWGIDGLKVDGCNADIGDYGRTYPLLGQLLNLTGRPILYSCSWPAYLEDHGEADDIIGSAMAPACNLWRNYNDLEDSWSAVMAVMEFWARGGPDDTMVQAAGPGHWNDPDMLMVGNNGLSESQQRSQFALWAMLSAPLYLTADLRKMPDWAKEIAQNEEVIEVNQDPLGKQGYVAWEQEGLRIWVKELASDIPGDYWAVVLQNTNAIFHMRLIELDVAQHIPGWDASTRFAVRALFERVDLGVYQGTFAADVDTSSVCAITIRKETVSQDQGQIGSITFHSMSISVSTMVL